MVTDDTGTAIVGATVTWSTKGTSASKGVATGAHGEFSLSRVPAGPYRLAVTSPGFAEQTLFGELSPGETALLPPILLTIAFNAISIDVRPTTAQIAERQIKQEEQQRFLGVLPNYFVVYAHDAAPLTPKQKVELSGKALFEPIDFALTGTMAGVQQARNDYSGFGRGTSGYAKRYAALYASVLTRTAIDGMLLPVLLKQDPRFFYKDTGSTASRFAYAIGTVFVRKGDNGHWQPNYSSMFGSLAAGALTNFYYPAQDRRGMRLTLENSAMSLATSAAAHLAQEFVFRKLTTHAGSRADDPRPSGESR